MKLSDQRVRELPLPVSGNRVFYDDDVKGFGARVTAKGARSFVVNYRTRDGRERRYTIGAFPDWKVTTARAEARRLKLAVDRGEDPMAAVHAARSATKVRKGAETFAEAVQDYVTREQRGRRLNATAGEVEKVLVRSCSGWLSRPVTEIDSRDIRALVEAIRDGDHRAEVAPRPYLAVKVHALLSGFFGWCAEPGIEKITASPMIGLKKPWKGEQPRDRVFNDDELRALWRASDEIGGTAGAYLKVLLLTGKRKLALAAMRWRDIDSSGFWTPPADNRLRRRTKRLHAMPLPRLALAAIESLRPPPASQEASPYVFRGRLRATHMDPGTPFQRTVKSASGVPDFFPHAARHTVETRMAELGIAPHVRDMLLDHAPVRGAGAGYDHHHYGPEMLDALERWAGHIEGLVTPAEVLSLRAATERVGAVVARADGGGEVVALKGRH
jgi:integrase